MWLFWAHLWYFYIFPLFYERRCSCFSIQRIIIQENTSLPLLSIFTRQEQLSSIICFQTGDLVYPRTQHPVICFPFGTKKKKNQPWPFMFHLHLWYMCNLSKHPRIAARQTGPVRPPPFIYCTLGAVHFSFFSTVFSYCRHLDRWGTLVLHWRALRLDSAARPRWSNRPFVWFLHKVCGCLHHLYVTADVPLFEKNCCFHMMHHNA